MTPRDDLESTPIEKIQANGALVIRLMRDNLGVELAYDTASVEWIDGYIERNRTTLKPEVSEKLISVLGSFVGECIRHEFGGKWVEKNDTWGVEVKPDKVAFPFAKVSKQFANGHHGGDSVYSFFRVLPALFEINPAPDTPPSEATP